MLTFFVKTPNVGSMDLLTGFLFLTVAFLLTAHIAKM